MRRLWRELKWWNARRIWRELRWHNAPFGPGVLLGMVGLLLKLPASLFVIAGYNLIALVFDFFVAVFFILAFATEIWPP